jgi:hypothetical protein
MKAVLKIGNAQAFWGDYTEAASELVLNQPDLDYLTLDYLSEVSLSIMAVQRAKDPLSGYARDFLDIIKTLVPFWKDGKPVKVVTNAGGLNPKLCALACAEILKQASCAKRIGIVSGDDVFKEIRSNSKNSFFNNLDTHEPINTVLDSLETANAYLGAKPIVEALTKGADIVITGRTADPSLTVGPCIAHFNWSFSDYDRLAQATLAGHLIECGTQVTGGISCNWLNLPNLSTMGFPFIEMEQDGVFVITKPNGTGGQVTIESVKEQLLYELGDPGAYLSPDVTMSVLSVSLENAGKERIRVSGAIGSPPPETYKVSCTYRDGFKAEAMLAIFGKQSRAKAKRCGEIIVERMFRAGFGPERSSIECLGSGDLVPGIGINQEALECLLRISVADRRKEVVEFFTKQIAPLVTSGPAGTTGYTSGRPHIRPVFGYWPCLIEAASIRPKVEIIEVES